MNSGSGQKRKEWKSTRNKMFCDICRKNEATIHFKHVSHENIVQVNVCESCASEKGMDFFSFEDMQLGSKHFSVADLLAGIIDVYPGEREDSRVKKCPNCGLTYEDFRRTGRLGCSGCYEAFKKKLIPLLKRVQGATCHSGKTPENPAGGKDKGPDEGAAGLKKELKKAIANEEYEKAAVLRDKIKEMEKKEKSNWPGGSQGETG